MTDGRMGSREACKGVLLPVKVLEYARQGGDWFLRVQRDFCCGWRPRHPVTGATLNASSLLAWAAGELGSDDKIQEAADLALVELEHIALNDVGDVASSGINCPEAIAALPESVRRAIAGWSWDTQGRLVIKFHDKLAGLRLLLQATGNIIDKHELGGKDGGPIVQRIERVIVDARDTDATDA